MLVRMRRGRTSDKIFTFCLVEKSGMIEWSALGEKEREDKDATRNL